MHSASVEIKKLSASSILAICKTAWNGNHDRATQVQTRDQFLTKPRGSLGRLEAIAQWVAIWQDSYPPKADRIHVCVFAGNHGVVAQGVSAFPQAVTAQMVLNFEAGGAAINQLCKTNGLTLSVHPLALETPTQDFTVSPALTAEELDDALSVGWNAVPTGTDLLCIGEMGIGNTTAAAAIYHALFGAQPRDWVGPGTGVDSAGIARKADVIGRAIELHSKHFATPLDVLRCVGGREIAAMFAAIVSARASRVPVLVDGYVATAAAAIAHAIDPALLDHCEIAHCSAEPAHGLGLKRLGRKPLIDLGMRLGEASGAALAAMIVRNAVSLHNGMATFDAAGVSEKSA